jgi:uncharacterized protein YjbI with pentapeptide repeats
MTAQPEAAATPSPGQGGRFESFAELRKAHLDLRDSFLAALRGSGGAAKSQLRDFTAKAQKTGAILTDPSTRKAAQGILDYWCAELAGLPDAKPEDFMPLTLAPAAISTLPGVQTTQEVDPSIQQSKEDQRALIRLSAMARQWQQAGRQPGYLLTSEALAQARRFAQHDTDLLELVQASDAAERAKRRRQRNVVYGFMLLAAVAASITSVLFWQFYALPETTKSWIRQIKATTSSEVETINLEWLASVQPWTPPYDLSGTPKLTNILFPGLRLYAPNFSGVEFSRVKLPKAQLPSASFSASYIYIDPKSEYPVERPFKWNDIRSWFGWMPYWHNVKWNDVRTWRHREPDWKNVKWNDFTGAALTLAQFRGAQIIATSFWGADLYRTVFDRALLCDVNFARADLRKASFWGAAMDDRTYAWLRKTAWWVATGWSEENFERLSNPQTQNPSDPQSQSIRQAASAAAAQDLRDALSTSDRFSAEVALIAEIRPGTFDRAVALNDMAWTLTTWGTDKGNLKESPPCNPNWTPPKKIDASGQAALDAAGQAICIIEELKKKTSQEKADQETDYDYWLANFRDTQAYIMMQANRMPEALALYEKDIKLTEADPGMLFRYAVALNANDKANEATPKFETAIRDKRYLPMTELHNLKQYIPFQFLGMAKDVMKAEYPEPKPATSCPSGSPD